jgi:hypothetical protein
MIVAKGKIINSKQININGQALVEFVILLTIIFILCGGMLYSSRLLTFDYWAQQEARYIAFEQTWVGSAYYNNPSIQPVSKMSETEYLHRPRVLDKLDVERDVSDDGNVNSLLAFLTTPFTRNTFSNSAQQGQRTQNQVMIAKKPSSVWHARTSDWFEGRSNKFFSIKNAFASQRGSSSTPDMHDYDIKPRRKGATYDNELQMGFVNILESVDFGPGFCEAMNGYLDRKGYQSTNYFSDPDCGTNANKGFASHVANNISFKDFFREYNFQLQWGLDSKEALEVAVKQEVAIQFYSWFDMAVRLSFIGTIPGILADRANKSDIVLNDAAINRMMSEMRYIGSSFAIGAILLKFGEIVLSNPTNRRALIEKAFEDSVNQVLHLDAADLSASVPLIDNGFFLSPEYLPVPPTFGPFAGGMFSGVMRNILANEEHLFGPLIDNSNKVGKVSYRAERGLFPFARRKWSTQDRVLSSSFYLVTQPWHITRRMHNGKGEFRAIGGQFDTINQETEEGILRRRVLGLWLFPSRPSALLEPIKDAPGMDNLGNVFSVFETVDDAIATVKELLVDNPLIRVFDALARIPGFRRFVPRIPKWPAVRPEAYPGTVEMKDDELTGEVKDFKDYIKDQRDFNPEPKPRFN